MFVFTLVGLSRIFTMRWDRNQSGECARPGRTPTDCIGSTLAVKYPGQADWIRWKPALAMLRPLLGRRQFVRRRKVEDGISVAIQAILEQI
jgi:hypothetical protein